MLVPAGSPIFFLRERRFAVRCRVITLRQLFCYGHCVHCLFMWSACLLDYCTYSFLYILFISIGCATLYYLSMMYVTVYNMSFNSNCRILAAELNYRFTASFSYKIGSGPECSTWQAGTSFPTLGALAYFYQKCHISNTGGTTMDYINTVHEKHSCLH